jgi:hypothetical protein
MVQCVQGAPGERPGSAWGAHSLVQECPREHQDPQSGKEHPWGPESTLPNLGACSQRRSHLEHGSEGGATPGRELWKH